MGIYRDSSLGCSNPFSGQGSRRRLLRHGCEKACLLMLLRWKPWILLTAEGGRLMSWGRVAGASQQMLNYLWLTLCFGARNTSLEKF